MVLLPALMMISMIVVICMRVTKERWMSIFPAEIPDSIKFLIVSSSLIFALSIIIAMIKFFYSCIISQNYIVNLIGFILFISPIIAICMIRIKRANDRIKHNRRMDEIDRAVHYYNSREGKLELINRDYDGSIFCPSFFDLTLIYTMILKYIHY